MWDVFVTTNGVVVVVDSLLLLSFLLCRVVFVPASVTLFAVAFLFFICCCCWQEQCGRYFGTTIDPQWSEVAFGGYSITDNPASGLSNTILSNG